MKYFHNYRDSFVSSMAESTQEMRQHDEVRTSSPRLYVISSYFDTDAQHWRKKWNENIWFLRSLYARFITEKNLFRLKTGSNGRF